MGGVSESVTNRIMGADVSLTVSGYAVFDREKREPEHLIHSGMFRGPRKGSLDDRILVICDRFAKIASDWKVSAVVIEDAKFTWKVEGRSQRAFAKLNQVIGAVAARLTADGLTVHRVIAQEWKGNKKKEKTVWEINLRYGLILEEGEHHIADAIDVCSYHINKEELEKRIR